MSDISETDISAMRQQGDLTDYIRQTTAAAADACARRRALVHRYPDLADRVAAVPGQRAWNGYIAPATWNGAANTSPTRAALLRIVAEAEARAGNAAPAAREKPAAPAPAARLGAGTWPTRAAS